MNMYVRPARALGPTDHVGRCSPLACELAAALRRLAGGGGGGGAEVDDPDPDTASEALPEAKSCSPPAGANHTISTLCSQGFMVRACNRFYGVCAAAHTPKNIYIQYMYIYSLLFCGKY